jgi:hypothetical protein
VQLKVADRDGAWHAGMCPRLWLLATKTRAWIENALR